MGKELNYLLFSQVRFWEKNAGNCLIVEKAAREFPADRKYLAVPFLRKKSLKKKLRQEYRLEDVRCFFSLKVFLIRAIRGILFRLKLPIPYFLLRPFKRTKYRKSRFYSYLKKNHIQVVQCEYIWFSDRLHKAYKDPSITTIIETHDIQNLFCQSLIDNFKRSKNFVTEKDEADLLNQASFVTAVSTKDYEFFKARLKTDVVYLPPIGIQPGDAFVKDKKDDGKLHIGFIAGDGEFNRYAVRFFIDEVRPFLSKEIPCVFDVFGSICNAFRSFIGQDSICLHGFVKDEKDIYSLVDVRVNPTNQDGGVKVKNLESLHYATPVLTSLKGRRGLEGAKEKGALFVCNTKEDYVSVLKNFFRNKEKLEEASHKATEFVKEAFSEKIYEDYYERIKESADGK